MSFGSKSTFLTSQLTEFLTATTTSLGSIAMFYSPATHGWQMRRRLFERRMLCNYLKERYAFPRGPWLSKEWAINYPVLP